MPSMIDILVGKLYPWLRAHLAGQMPSCKLWRSRLTIYPAIGVRPFESNKFITLTKYWRENKRGSGCLVMKAVNWKKKRSNCESLTLLSCLWLILSFMLLMPPFFCSCSILLQLLSPNTRPATLLKFSLSVKIVDPGAWNKHNILFAWKSWRFKHTILFAWKSWTLDIEIKGSILVAWKLWSS